ncbi:MAG: phy [Lacunisphaera sp.]|nr:phy [Lacunisphaera sp.]
MHRSLLLRQVLLVVCLVLAPVLRSAETYEPFRPDLAAGAAYRIDALKLHPTQFALGFREVAYKTRVIDGKNAAALLAYLQEKDVPVVIGPGGVPYMADGHHTIRALLESHQSDKTVYGHIIADWSGLKPDVFWAQMRAKHYAYLKDKDGQARPTAELPATLLSMQSDIYRGLGWAVMKAGGFTELKGSDAFFQEFYWGEYFRDRLHWNDDEADFQRALKDALTLAHEPAAASLPGYTPQK